MEPRRISYDGEKIFAPSTYTIISLNTPNKSPKRLREAVNEELAKIRAQEEDVSDLMDKLEAATKANEEYDTGVNQLQDQVEAGKAKFDEYEVTIAGLNITMERLNHKIYDLTMKNKEFEEEVDELNIEINELHENYKNDVAKLNDEIENLNKSYEQLEEEYHWVVAEYKMQAHQKDERIKLLKEKKKEYELDEAAHYFNKEAMDGLLEEVIEENKRLNRRISVLEDRTYDIPDSPPHSNSPYSPNNVFDGASSSSSSSCANSIKNYHLD